MGHIHKTFVKHPYFLLCISVNIINSALGGDRYSAINSTWVDKLRQDLLRYYDSYARPSSEDRPTNVNIKLKIRSVNLDYETSVFTLNGWIIMEWLDYKLTWNSTEYNGLKQVHIANHEIWKPDIIAYNSIAADTSNHYEGTNFIVNSSGRVVWMPPTTYKIFCDIDIRRWPYDVQTCNLILNSLTYDSTSVNLNTDTIKEKNIFMKNATYGWKILDLSYKRNEVYSVCCPEPYVTIEYFFTMEKAHHLFHTFITLPAIGNVILLLSAFWLLPEQVEKFLITGLVCVTSCMFLVFYSNKVPVLIHQTPDIIKFYTLLLCLSTTYLMLSVMLYNVSSTSLVNKKKLPNCFFNFIHSYSKILFLFAPKQRIYGNEFPADVSSLDETYIKEDGKDISAQDGVLEYDMSHVQWCQFAVVIDRFLFLVYFITCLTMSYSFICS